MPLTGLEIQDYRSLGSVVIEPGARLNVVEGENASGKTTVLEAIHTLATGRSFRTKHWNEVIRRGAGGFRIQGRVGNLPIPGRLGFGVQDGQRLIEVNGRMVSSAAELAKQLPLLAITPELQYDFLRSSRYRRSILDWVLFHVEPDFYPNWLRYHRALSQRNALLRNPSTPTSPRIWDTHLAAAGELLAEARQRFFTMLDEEFQDISRRLLLQSTARLNYARGWREGGALLQTLEENRSEDLRRGYTRLGPHHADLYFELDQEGRHACSHGQQKILVMALRLAQLRLYERITAQECVLLADDINAELDQHHQKRLWEYLESLASQVFVTTLSGTHLQLRGGKMFHVEPQSRYPIPVPLASNPKKSNEITSEVLE